MQKFIKVSLLTLGAMLCIAGNVDAAIYNLFTGTSGGNLYTAPNSGGTVYAPVANGQLTLSTNVYSTSVTAIFSRRDGLINYTNGGPGSVGDGSSGSGTYTRMFAVEQNGQNFVERGYNGTPADDSNNSPQNGQQDYNQKQGVGEPKVFVGDIRVVTYNSQKYFEILLDGQENDNAVTIDQLMVFTAPGKVDLNDTWVAANPDPTPAQLIAQFEAAGATLRYSLDSLGANNAISTDNTILVRAETGSGAGDLGFYLPVGAVTNFQATYTGNGTASTLTDRFYVWVKQGGEVGDLFLAGAKANENIDFGAGATYEEWAYRKNGTTLNSLLPEPGTGLGGLLTGLLFTMARPARNRRNSRS